MRSTMKTIVALLVMSLPAFAHAQINKCMDASGKVVGYGNECPAGTRSEQTTVQNAPSTSAGPAAAGAPKTLAERDADFRKRQIEKQESDAKAAKKTAEADQRRRACEDTRTYLTTLQTGQRVTRTDPRTGERTFLSD